MQSGSEIVPISILSPPLSDFTPSPQNQWNYDVNQQPQHSEEYDTPDLLPEQPHPEYKEILQDQNYQYQVDQELKPLQNQELKPQYYQELNFQYNQELMPQYYQDIKPKQQQELQILHQQQLQRQQQLHHQQQLQHEQQKYSRHKLLYMYGHPYLNYVQGWNPQYAQHFYQQNPSSGINNSANIPQPQKTEVDVKFKSPDVPLKRTRTFYKPQQILRLESLFQEHSYISRNQKITLASEIQLTEKQIKVWFQNRRIRQKKLDSAKQNQLLESRSKENSEIYNISTNIDENIAAKILSEIDESPVITNFLEKGDVESVINSSLNE